MKQNGSKKGKKPEAGERVVEQKVPGARSGGQTDSPTGSKPGGGGKGSKAAG